MFITCFTLLLGTLNYHCVCYTNKINLFVATEEKNCITKLFFEMDMLILAKMSDIKALRERLIKIDSNGEKREVIQGGTL